MRLQYYVKKFWDFITGNSQNRCYLCGKIIGNREVFYKKQTCMACDKLMFEKLIEDKGRKN